MRFTYILAEGNEQIVDIDVSAFLHESEYGVGLQVVNHIVSIKKDNDSESFLSISDKGIKLAGIQDAIDDAESAANGYADGLNTTMDARVKELETAIGENGSVSEQIAAAIENLDATVGSQAVAEGKHVAVEVVEENGKLTGLTVVESDIASAKELSEYKTSNNAAVKAADDAAKAAQSHSEGVASDLTEYETANDTRVKAVEDSLAEAADTYLVKGDYALKSVLPTKVSQLENDVPYALKSDVEVEVENGVYAITADGKLIDYNLADATAIGVALVAGEHKFMIAKSDATDGTNTTLYWGRNLYGKIIDSVVNNDKVDGTNSNGYLPKPDGTFDNTPHLSGDFTTWTAGALSEFNGKTNTAAILAAYTEHGVEMNTRDMCSALNTFNTSDSHNDWYIPALGQLTLMYLNMAEINAALAKIGGTALTAAGYWSSSLYSYIHAWAVLFNVNYITSYSKDTNGRVRFVRDLTIKKPLKEKVSEIEASVSELLFNVYTKEEIDSMLSISKYEFVDLGLPSGLKWAAWNVGATKPEEFGLYFAWGETQGYSGITDEKQFTWEDYELCNGTNSTLTKYNKSSSFGTVDNLTTLELVDDSAYVSDNTSRMPTKADFEELIANTTSVWGTLNGVYGIRFTSTNGNSIFVPAAGGCGNGSVDGVGSYGVLWGSSFDESRLIGGWSLYFGPRFADVGSDYRYYGFSVRAVQEANTNTKFNPSETVSKVNNIESQIGDINTILESILKNLNIN